jgi:hypothetical protein
MTYACITPAKIRVSSHSNLVAAWRAHGDMLVGAYVCKANLTPSQLRRLPKALQDILRHGGGAE